MNNTLAHLMSRRLWLIENMVVWGSLSSYLGSFLLTEEEGGTTTIYHWHASIGGDVQQIAFADITDSRGNSLPATINRPKVIVLPKSEVPVVVVGRESGSSFRIAKAGGDLSPGVVDLLIMEVGD